MYYSIRHQTEKKEIGHYSQVSCLTQSGQAHKLSSWRFPDFEVNLIFELEKKAKLTDFLSNSSINARGFLVNQKIKDILADFILLNHQFYPATVKTSKGDLQYYWLHLCEPEIIHTLDYKKSVFYETNYTFREDIIKIDSFNDYEKRKALDTEASFGVELEQIFVSDAFNKKLDMFTFLPFDNRIYISEKLQIALNKNNVTGINMIQAPNLVI